MTSESIFRRDRVTIVGVLNLTPDSFSDGGRFVDMEERVSVARAVSAAGELVAAGADLLDVGGESTRPGAKPVSPEREIQRVIPVIEALRKRFEVPVSIDTRNALCARAALDEGAEMVNDVSGLAHDGTLGEVVAGSGATLVLGHMRGTPETMRAHSVYKDVLGEVVLELREAVERAVTAGVDPGNLVIDPGIGFSKQPAASLAVLVASDWLKEQLGLPVLVGPFSKVVSRCSDGGGGWGARRIDVGGLCLGGLHRCRRHTGTRTVGCRAGGSIGEGGPGRIPGGSGRRLKASVAAAVRGGIRLLGGYDFCSRLEAAIGGLWWAHGGVGRRGGLSSLHAGSPKRD